MKLHAMDPTEEKVIGRFCDDKIGRNADVLQFVALLGKIRENASISVDAPWGAGKTFFVKQVKLVLDSCNAFSSLSNETKTRVAKACEQALAEKDVRGEPQVCVYYDAWANDNDEEPILSLVYSILKESGVNPSLKMNEKQPLLTILEQLAEMITGRPIKQFFDAIKSVDCLSDIKDTKSICMLVNEFFDSLLPEKGNRLVIIIDELDRCRPDFAVRLLERIKHYFVNDKITFVFSVNSHQLQHTIKRHYGDGFDATRYLDRFFDLRIDLPPADMQKFYQSIGLKDGHWVYEQVCRELAEYFNMQMRESTRFYNTAKIAAYRPTHDTVEHVYPL